MARRLGRLRRYIVSVRGWTIFTRMVPGPCRRELGVRRIRLAGRLSHLGELFRANRLVWRGGNASLRPAVWIASAIASHPRRGFVSLYADDWRTNLASVAFFRVPAHFPDQNGNCEGLFVGKAALCEFLALMLRDKFRDILVVVVLRQFSKSFMLLEVVVAV